MRVVMIGTGYVGLVSGACFADFGHKVVCIDKATFKIDALHRGEMPIFEPGLDEIVAENVRSGRLSFSTQFDAVADADVVFLAVGTPARRGGARLRCGDQLSLLDSPKGRADGGGLPPGLQPAAVLATTRARMRHGRQWQQ